MNRSQFNFKYGVINPSDKETKIKHFNYDDYKQNTSNND